MRIIGGAARGLRIAGPGTKKGIRPTSDKVREALFNMIDPFAASFLELFAGTGAVACEALSRGAERAVLVESRRSMLNIIRKNLAGTVRMIDGEPRVDLLETDVLSFLARPARESFDIVFCDPPYDFKNPANVIGNLFDGGFVKESGLVVYETFSKKSPEMPEPDKIRKYGDTSLLFYLHAGMNKK